MAVFNSAYPLTRHRSLFLGLGVKARDEGQYFINLILMMVKKFGYVNFIGRVDLEYDGNWNIDGVDNTHEIIELLAT